MTNDLIKYGKLETSLGDYLKGMGVAGLTAGLMSFGTSVYDYATWNRLTVDEKMTKLQNKFGENVKYDPTMTHKAGSIDLANNNVCLGPDALTNKSWAHSTVRHELQHLSDFSTKFDLGAFFKDESYMTNFTHQTEIKAYLLNMSDRTIPSKLYIGSYKFIQRNHGYKGYGVFNPFITFNYIFF